MTASPPRHPRVAIVSANPMRDDTNNGMLLRSLFSGWPRERLGQVFFRVVVPHRPTGDDCAEVFAIGLDAVARRVGPPRGRGARSPVPGEGERPSLRSLAMLGLGRTGTPLRWARSLVHLWSARPAVARALSRRLAELRPDVVYGYVGDYPVTRAVTAACRGLGLPLYLHVADDFVSSLYRGQPLGPRLRRASERWFLRAVETADGLAAISPFMAAEYARRYGHDWTWFTTLVDPDAYDPQPPPPRRTTRLVYAGGLGRDRWRALQRLADTLARWTARDGPRTQISVYCPQRDATAHRRQLEGAGVRVHGWVPPTASRRSSATPTCCSTSRAPREPSSSTRGCRSRRSSANI